MSYHYILQKGSTGLFVMVPLNLTFLVFYNILAHLSTQGELL